MTKATVDHQQPSDRAITQLGITAKDGMDGAGAQMKIKWYEGQTMELMGYCILEITDLTEPVSNS